MIRKEKTILFVMPRLPFPTSSGRKTSLYHYCRILSKELGYRLVVAAFLEGGDNPSSKPEFIDRLVILPKASIRERLLEIMVESVLLQKKPMQVSLYWSRDAKKIIDQLVEEERPQIVIGDMVRSTEYIKDISAYRIADLDDRLSLRYKRQLEADINNINPYGAFLNSVPRIVQKGMLWKPLKVYVVKNEIRLLKKYELEIAKQCDKVIFVAPKEADDFNRELKESKACAIPIGVDINFFSYRKNDSKGECIGFLGAMNVAHNENAVRHFIFDILPEIIRERPEVKFLVIGGGVSESLRRLESKYVHFTGRVEDVREYLEKCKIFVCPMTFGSGIKTKNLEAMSMGIPVITTNIGAENINAYSGKDWIVEDSNNGFAKAVVELLVDDSKRNGIGLNGSAFVRKNFTWDIAKNQFTVLLRGL